MRKTVEVEYVGIEDLQDILDDAYALMKEGHYIEYRMTNTINPMVTINVYIGGWDKDKIDADYSFTFYINDKKQEVEIMNECKNTLKNLLVEE